MFEKFSQDAIIVVMLGQEEAKRLGQNVCGSEHILLGLLGRGGKAATVMNSVGLTLAQARIEVKAAHKERGEQPAQRSWFKALFGVFDEVTFSNSTKEVFETSCADAEMQQVAVDSDHLFFALLGEQDGLATKILKRHVADVDQLRQALIALKAA